jgi:transposase-like protein
MSYQEIEEMMAERGVIVSYNAKAAARFFPKLLTKFALRATGADHRQLASYGVAHRRLIPSVEHRRSKYLNNRAETPTSPPGSENGR